MQKRKRVERDIIYIYGSKCIEMVETAYKDDNLYIVTPNTKWHDGVFEESTIWFQGIPQPKKREASINSGPWHWEEEDAAYKLYEMVTSNKSTKGFLMEPKGEIQWINPPRIIISDVRTFAPSCATIVINSDA